MTVKTSEEVRTETLQHLRYRVTDKHKLVTGSSWIGVDIHQVTDVGLLVEWWNKLLRVGGPVNRIADKDLHLLQCALWVRINALHPTRALKFEDLESVEKILESYDFAAV